MNNWELNYHRTYISLYQNKFGISSTYDQELKTYNYLISL
jgi:hypothetical protein